MSGEGARMTTAQAAEALGVRPATVYAYVSRGVLRRESLRDGGRRVSLFDRQEVLALAAERARPRAGVVSTLIESDVTELEPRGRLAFRGRDVAELAALPFEEAAAVVWRDDGGWPDPDAAWAAAVDRGLPAGIADPRDRVLLATTLAAAADPAREDIGRDHVLRVARAAIRLGVRAVAGTSEVPEGAAPAGAGVAEGLWRALTGRAPEEAERRALETALVLLMDHELAASTLAARVAASTRADPWSCLLAGYAALRGPRHGGAAAQAVAMVRGAAGADPDGAVVAESVVIGTDSATAGHDRPPAGFGHAVYETIDPRAELLLDRVAVLAPELSAAIEDLATAVLRRHGLFPNVDLALAALEVGTDLPRGSPEVVFLLARTVGFAAHILEEYPHGLRYRPRAVGG